MMKVSLLTTRGKIGGVASQESQELAGAEDRISSQSKK